MDEPFVEPGCAAGEHLLRPAVAPTACWALVAAFALSIPAAPAGAQGDYSIVSRAWNGLSELGELASEAGIPWVADGALDLRELQPNDALLILFPKGDLPRDDLSAFLHAGGRIAIADDFGGAESWLLGFDITRRPVRAGSDAPRLRGNRNLLIAEPGAPHPLSREVQALVVNHAAVLDHRALAPVFRLGAGGGAVVLSGAVGEGRLVALGDPSMLINNMLELSGNRRFARNLLSYLAQHDGRLFIITSSDAIVGRFGGQRPNPGIERLRALLASAARLSLPEGTLRVLSAALALTLLLATVTGVPRREQYLRALERSRPENSPVPAGDAGLLAHYVDGERASVGERNLLVPLLRYRQGLLHALAQRLALPPADDGAARAILHAARAAGLGAEAVAELRRLLDDLGTLAIESEHPLPPRVGERKFRAMIGTGERMLGALDAALSRRPRA